MDKLEAQGIIRSGWAAKISVKMAKLTNIKRVPTSWIPVGRSGNL
ncbi:MAG: hypothetical protein ACLSA6_07260 [Holdemania massiliensis]